MSTRVDQRGKNQQPPPNHQVNGSARVEEYDYVHHQMHGQPHPQQAQYSAGMQMSTPTNDNYMSNYYHQPMNMNYPAGFFDAGAWSSSSTDPLSYLGGYGQPVGADYMQFSGFDYSNGFWQGYQPDYAWAPTPQPQDPMKIMEGQSYMPTMDQAYTETYHSPTGAHQNSVTNGQEAGPANLTESDDVTELEQGMQMVSVNGISDPNQESTSETSVHEPTMGNVNNSSLMPSSGSPSQPKVTSWANIAKKPAKPAPIPPKILTRPPPPKTSHDNNWEKGTPRGNAVSHGQRGNTWSTPRSQRNGTTSTNSEKPSNQKLNGSKLNKDADATLNAYNPKNFDLTAKNARFFVIKSYSEDDIHRAIKYGVWCSTEHGNKRLDAAFKERTGKGPIYLFYSVNGSGHFCGMAQMMSGVDYHTDVGVWTQDKWKGSMVIKWVYVKDVPNGQLRHIRLENNENKPVTNSRDTQEVPPEKGRLVLKIIHGYRHTTSIFDDFGHYDQKEVAEGGESTEKKKASPKPVNGSKN